MIVLPSYLLVYCRNESKLTSDIAYDTVLSAFVITLLIVSFHMFTRSYISGTTPPFSPQDSNCKFYRFIRVSNTYSIFLHTRWEIRFHGPKVCINARIVFTNYLYTTI